MQQTLDIVIATRSLDIVIVNWNSGLLLGECLESIRRAQKDGWRLGGVVVVDNASHDASLERLSDVELPLEIVRNATNRGFAAACNQGARLVESSYVLFLNPDVRVFPDSIKEALGFMESSQSHGIGICGLQLLGSDGSVLASCARFPTPAGLLSMMFGLSHFFPQCFPRQLMVEWDHSCTREVEQVMGAAFLVRRDVFKKLGGFDERFFVYYEEVDFSLRARQQGWRSIYLANARAYHEGGGTTRSVRGLARFFYLRSRILFVFKHFGRIPAIVVLLGTLVIEPISRLALGVRNVSLKEVAVTVEAHLRLWKSLPTIIRGLWAGAA